MTKSTPLESGFTQARFKALLLALAASLALAFPVAAHATEAPHVEPLPAQTEHIQLAAIENVTEAQAYERMMALKGEYYEGRPWTNDNTYYSAPLYYYGGGCHAFALILSDAAFGENPGTTYYDLSTIRVGDILRIYNDTHSVVVLEVQPSGVVVAEGNYNSSIHWGRFIPFSELANGFDWGITRYATTAACEHEWQSYVIKEPTCSEPGVRHYVCPKCGTEYDEEIPATGRPSENCFLDVTSDAWYYQAVQYAVSNGLMGGYGNGYYGPNDTLTRAQGAVILWRYFAPNEAATYENIMASTPNKTGMPDVEAAAWYTAAANWAVREGVISGVEKPDGSRQFNPNGTITREQLCAIIGKAAEAFCGDTVAGADRALMNSMRGSGEVSSWALDSVAWGLNRKIISGKETPQGRSIDPQNPVQRAEMSAVMMNALKGGVIWR